MQKNSGGIDMEEEGRKAKKIIFDEEVKRLRIICEEGAREQEFIQEVINAEKARIKKEWLNENRNLVKGWSKDFLATCSLEQLKQLIAEQRKEKINSDKNNKGCLISILAFILAVFIAYVVHSLTLFIIALLGLSVSPIFFLSGQAVETQPQNPDMICPHCKTKGQVLTEPVNLKKGVSGGKAVAGLLTGGLSLLAVGLSRTENSTKATCGKCKNVWHF
ncbi:MAG: hypothetical protein Q8L68_03755 [Methylococcales bacterium]|nr:hypothetical protein [Methylococcales bacterium]